MLIASSLHVETDLGDWDLSGMQMARRLEDFAMLITLEPPQISVPSSIPRAGSAHLHLLSHFVVNLPSVCQTVDLVIRFSEAGTSDQLLALLQRINWCAMASRLQAMPNIQSLSCTTRPSPNASSRIVANVVPCIVHHAFSFFPCSEGESSRFYVPSRADRLS